MPDWNRMLRDGAAAYAGVALANIGRELPTMVLHVMAGPDDMPGRPRDETPVFYGSFDWHSCVEMHWLLVRLLRAAGDAVPAAEIRTVLDGQFRPAGLAAEAAAVAGRTGAGQRPYGWGWALSLVHETSTWDDPDAGRWSAAMAPFAEALTERFLGWLPEGDLPGPLRPAPEQRLRPVPGAAVRGQPRGRRRHRAARRDHREGAGLVRRRYRLSGPVRAVRA